jgi:proteic killer suppression protein
MGVISETEHLGGDRRGQFSIRINQRYRICFIWTERGHARMEIVAEIPT